MNFTKNNMNKNIVTYLTKDMKFKTLSEREFVKEFEKNIRKLCIELFYIHKNNLSVKQLIDYMKSLLLGMSSNKEVDFILHLHIKNMCSNYCPLH